MKNDPRSDRASAGAEDIQSKAEGLSAWLDGELDEPAAEPLVRELLGGGPLRRKYQSWCVVGDALRSQEVAGEHSPRLCTRIARALQDEPVLLAPRALSARVRHQLASGVAVAGAMAVLVLVAVPLLRGTDSSSGVSGQTTARSAGAGDLTVRDTTGVATLGTGAAASMHQPRLDPYLQAHRDFTADGVMPAAAIYLRSGNESDR